MHPYNALLSHAWTALRSIDDGKYAGGDHHIVKPFDLSQYVSKGRIDERILFITNKAIFYVKN
jgi:hypothetical protein